MWTYEFPDMKHYALRNSDRLFQEGNPSAIQGEDGENMKIFVIEAVRIKSGGGIGKGGLHIIFSIQTEGFDLVVKSLFGNTQGFLRFFGTEGKNARSHWCLEDRIC